MWYNVIPTFVPLDLSSCPTYPTRTKGLDPTIYRNYISYVLGYVYLVLEQHVVPPTYTPHSIGNYFPTVVQLVISKDKELVQQQVIAPLLTIVHVITLILTIVQVNICLPKGFAHQPLDGGDSP